MRSIKDYILEKSGMMLSERDKKKLLTLDKKFWEIAVIYHKCKNRYVTNIDEEFEKFIKAYNKGEKYYPILEYKGEICYKEKHVIEKINTLTREFMNFNCFLSKYYLEILSAYKLMILGCIDPIKNYQNFNIVRLQKPSQDMYRLALETIKENPYEEIDKSKRNIKAEQAKKEIEDYLDELDWDWDVNIDNNMIPRMAVGAEKMNINANGTFSDIDIEGLKAHEVKGHVGRRYYAHKTGLYLMLEGLLGRNTLDEGLAVWNSLNLVKKKKPNILFNIALKTVIAFNLDTHDFVELFKICKDLAPNLADKIIFKNIIRYKRELKYCKLPGGNGDDMSYFCGYMIVKDMNDKERDDILKYNIGPEQIKDLPKIKRFFELNKFESLI